MIEMVAEAPWYRPDGVPVTLMTTGKVATPELVEAMRPIEATVPRTGPAAFWVVITAWSPVLIRPTTVASTLALMMSLALITVIEPELPELVPPDPPPPLSPPPDPLPDPPPPDPLPDPPPPDPLPDPPPPDPLPDPPPPPDPLPPPLICWPAVSPTVTTMPSIGEVSVAPLSAALALSAWDWAALTDAWSAASWAVDALLAWSWESWDWAPARLASACAACALSEGESMVARVWPIVTRCPTCTSTAVTCPAALKLSVSVVAGSMVPLVESACRRGVGAAGNKRYGGRDEPVDRVAAQAPSDAAARTMSTAGRAIRGRERRLRARGRRFLRRGAFWWAAGPAAADESASPRAERRVSMPVSTSGRDRRPRLLPVPSFMEKIPLIGRVPVRMTCAGQVRCGPGQPGRASRGTAHSQWPARGPSRIARESAAGPRVPRGRGPCRHTGEPDRRSYHRGRPARLPGDLIPWYDTRGRDDRAAREV